MAFTFTGTAAAGTSAAAGATTGGVSPWYRLSERTAASSFTLTGPVTGTFTATIQLEYSNAPDFDKGYDFNIDDTLLSAPSLRALPVGIGDYVRGRCTAYTTGSPRLRFATALDDDGRPFSITEDTKKTPAPSSEAS